MSDESTDERSESHEDAQCVFVVQCRILLGSGWLQPDRRAHICVCYHKWCENYMYFLIEYEYALEEQSRIGLLSVQSNPSASYQCNNLALPTAISDNF